MKRKQTHLLRRTFVLCFLFVYLFAKDLLLILLAYMHLCLFSQVKYVTLLDKTAFVLLWVHEHKRGFNVS